MTRVWSNQQERVFHWVRNERGNALVEAVAGSGKTTTLVEAMGLMSGSVAFAAYNKKIATEIERRVGRVPNVRVGTFHSFGFSAWRRVAQDVRVDDRKVPTLVENMQVPEELHKFVVALVSLAKQRAFGVLTVLDDLGPWYDAVTHFDLEELLVEEAEHRTLEHGVEWARRVLRESSTLDREAIDFDDMIWSPLFHKARVWENDWVLVDECQDLNPARRALARRMLKRTGRLIAVGDRHQAIYGFTGADNNGMEVTQREFNCVQLPLTVTYRCPQRVVAEARQYVSHITAHESASEGRVVRLETEEFWRQVNNTQLGVEDAVLCRNTKPLVELAYQLIRRRIPCHVEGRDIGAGLLALANKWKSAKTLTKLRARLERYAADQSARLLAKGQELQLESLLDRVDTLYAIMDSLGPDADDVSLLRSAINDLFKDEDPPQSLTLSTVHKAKGREWNRVFLWQSTKFMPSGYARQQWQLDQEHNLLYVALTRAKETLVYVDEARG